jgi:hypothetical protein
MHSLRATINGLFSFSLVCFLLFFLPILNGPVMFILFLFANFAFLFGLVLSFDDAVPARARIAMAYLGFIAFIHLWVGAITIKNYFAAVFLQYSSVWPIWVLIHAIRSYANLVLSRGPDRYANLDSIETFELVATIVIVVSVFALGAVVAMAQRKRVGYGIWLAVIVVSFMAGLWVVLATAMVIADSTSLYSSGKGPPLWWSLVLPLTYAIAYWQARWDLDLA